MRTVCMNLDLRWGLVLTTFIVPLIFFSFERNCQCWEPGKSLKSELLLKQMFDMYWTQLEHVIALCSLDFIPTFVIWSIIKWISLLRPSILKSHYHAGFRCLSDLARLLWMNLWLTCFWTTWWPAEKQGNTWNMQVWGPWRPGLDTTNLESQCF